jgi:aldose 1-epimerase
VGSGVKFTRVSDCEDGFPGILTIAASYILTDENKLIMTWKAKLNEGQSASVVTPVNLMNHTYWNLSGDFKDQTIGEHSLWTPNCTKHTPLGENFMPQGTIEPALKDANFTSEK